MYALAGHQDPAMRLDRSWRTLSIVLWSVATTADAATTGVALQRGYREANPIPALLMELHGPAAVLVAGSLLCVLLCAVTLVRSRLRIVRMLQYGLVGLAGFKLVVATHNLALLYQG